MRMTTAHPGLTSRSQCSFRARTATCSTCMLAASLGRLVPVGGASADMVDITDIAEEHEIEAWLVERGMPLDTALLLAFRAAMRMAPRFLRDAPPCEINNEYRPQSTPLLRALLTTNFIASRFPSEQRKKKHDLPRIRSVSFLGVVVKCRATETATAAAYTAFTAQFSARSRDAGAAALAAREACRVSAETVFTSAEGELSWKAPHIDCNLAEASEDLKLVPLLFDETENGSEAVMERGQKKVLNAMLEAGSEWRFWHDWYRSVLFGSWMDPKLLASITRIDSQIWKAGDEVVNREIQKRYDAWLST